MTGYPYGHFADGCIHIRLDVPLEMPGMFREFLFAAGELVASFGGVDVGRARRRPGAQRTAAPDVLADRAATVRRRQGGVRSRGPAQSRCARRPGSRGPGPSDPGRAPGPGPARLPVRGRRRRLQAGRAPLHRRRQVPRRHRRPRRGDVPVLPGDPGGEGLHPRPGPGPAGDAQRHARHRVLALTGGARGPRTVPGMQGLCLRLSDRCRHGDVQIRSAAPELPGSAPSRHALHAGTAPALGGAGRSRTTRREHPRQAAGGWRPPD